MSHIRELLGTPPAARWPVAWDTGLAALDDLTGGFHPGEVWVVTGTPGQGCTTLLSQWAGMLAVTHRVPTWLLCPREDAERCAARVLASISKVPINESAYTSHGMAADQQSRLDSGKAALSGSELVVRVGQGVGIPGWDDEMGDRALVVDDADLAATCTPDRLRRAADEGALVIASLPRHVVVEDRHPDGDLAPGWARVADVIVEIRSRRLDGDIRGSRQGEAELAVLKFRRGPTRVTAVAFQGHYARFVDLR